MITRLYAKPWMSSLTVLSLGGSVVYITLHTACAEFALAWSSGGVYIQVQVDFLQTTL